MHTPGKPLLEVCLSPALLPLYDTKDRVVAIIDVFRATSTIAAALDNGADSVIPVDSIERCIETGRSIPGSITAGERNGQIAPGLQYGNSPLEYPRSFIEGRTLVLTTTNGTRLLHMIQGAGAIITASFLNLTAVSQFIADAGKPVLLACSSWKDRFNLEDTLCAGALVKLLEDRFQINCDSARCARLLAAQSGGAYYEFLKDSAHFHRLSAFGLERDMEYCATPDLHPVVPFLEGERLYAAGDRVHRIS